MTAPAAVGRLVDLFDRGIKGWVYGPFSLILSTPLVHRPL